MITAQIENWDQVWREMSERLWGPHYDEVCQDKEHMRPQTVDIEKYSRLNALGKLQTVTLRRDGRLVGYHVSIIDTLGHYRDVLAGSSDAYLIDHETRALGRASLRLFEAVERESRRRGVQILYDATKLGENDHARLFDLLGYEPFERRYKKWIGA